MQPTQKHSLLSRFDGDPQHWPGGGPHDGDVLRVLRVPGVLAGGAPGQRRPRERAHDPQRRAQVLHGLVPHVRIGYVIATALRVRLELHLYLEYNSLAITELAYCGSIISEFVSFLLKFRNITQIDENIHSLQCQHEHELGFLRKLPVFSCLDLLHLHCWSRYIKHSKHSIVYYISS